METNLGLIVVVAVVFILAYVRENVTFKRAIPRNKAATRHKAVARNEDDDSDSWEGGIWDAPNPHKLSVKLRIDYTDAKRQNTTRTVNVREFDDTLYGGILMGFCELREAHRTFRFDRIRSCVDMGTGEIIDDVRGYLNHLYDTSPDRTTDLLVSDYIDALKVIYYVAKADGQYRKAEKEVVTKYVQLLVRDSRITTEMIDSALKGIPVPSIQSFKLAVGRIVKGGQINPSLLEQCCKDIVSTQGTIHPSEQEALDYIAKRTSKS